jgi:hypothetical protein
VTAQSLKLHSMYSLWQNFFLSAAVGILSSTLGTTQHAQHSQQQTPQAGQTRLLTLALFLHRPLLALDSHQSFTRTQNPSMETLA